MKKRVVVTVVGGFLACLGPANPATATIRYVMPGGTGNGLGGWATATADLHGAMYASYAGDQVWVASGIYRPGSSRNAYFPLNAGVRVLGGFYADEQHPSDARDENPLTNGTVLTGDIGEPGTASDNCYCIVVATGTDPLTTILDGFTITSGYGGWYNNGLGAGLCIAGGASPTLANLRITDCFAPWGGGGVYVEDGSPAFTACRFESNRSAHGGALIATGGYQTMTLDRCIFLSNTADTQAAALCNWRSGNIVIKNTIFTANRCLGIEPGSTVANVYPANAQFVNCLIHANAGLTAAVLNGGGAGITLINNTITYNTSACGAYAGFYNQGTATVNNSLFWGNAAQDVQDETAQIAFTTLPLVRYCAIQGLVDQGGLDSGNNVQNLGDAAGFDPAFVAPAAGNLRLLPDSPCLNNGDNTVQGLPSDDLDGGARIVSDVVDRGVYEYHFVDCNGNNTPDAEDLANCDPDHPEWCDCNGNNVPDGCDIDPSDPDGDEWISPDCNANGIPDECDLHTGISQDCNHNDLPDECEFSDCNHNCIEDATDIAPGGGSDDRNANGLPDECEFSASGRWTEEADFATGTPINVHCNAGGWLERNTAEATAPLPYIWVAASGRGTVVRIDTETGDVLGEYRTAPQLYMEDCPPQSINASPSRTTVDLDASAWVANREDNMPISAPELGSVVKLGLVVGGTRVTKSGLSDPTGQYLAPPFDYCTCEDRDGDGLIRTSYGLGDILPWDNLAGLDDLGGVSSAEDECVLRYVRTAGTGMRTLAIDKSNDVWCGGSYNRRHEKLDGFTGERTGGPFDPEPCGGYGGVVTYWPDESSHIRRILWSTTGSGNNLLKGPESGNWECVSIDSRNVYGIAADRDGDLWITHWGNPTSPFHGLVSEFTRSEQIQGPYSTGVLAPNRGVAVTLDDDHVWVANSDAHRISRLDQSGNVVRVIDLNANNDGQVPTGVAVDAGGKVWASCRGSNTLKRIDPAGDGGLGVVDLTVSLGGGALPYNYSDMTGMVGLHTTGAGTWIVTHDGGREGIEWCRVLWNEEEDCSGVPEGTDLQVSVRASDYEAQLALSDYSPVASSGATLTGIVGRFIQVRVRFFATVPGVTPYLAPVLCDLAVIPNDTYAPGDVDLNGLIDGRDIQPFVKVLVGSNTGPAAYHAADLNHSGSVDLIDVDCFVQLLLSGHSDCEDLCAGRGIVDCNSNGIPDVSDLFNSTSEDCNQNWIPDECDIAEETSEDVNENSVPDECDPDCNGNSLPDDYDIAQQTSADIDSNGVPDECQPDCNKNGVPDYWDIDPQDPDGNELVSADCNENGVPDECEPDCNSNGVPDDCDIDPSDPDGDEWVSPDCNENQYPDECDIALGPGFGSMDCNENDVPDECDIADCDPEDPDCQDCNANGYPDSCDIEAEISLDEDENGIPDECEEQFLMGGGMMMGEGFAGGTPTLPGDPEAYFDAWIEYYEWLDEQEWGPDSELSGSEQFQLMVDKLIELGLPVRNPRQ